MGREMGAACPRGHRTRSWWERRGIRKSQRPCEPSLPQRKTLTRTPCEVCPGISHRRSDVARTRFLERETQLSWGPPETDAPRRHVRGHGGTRARELPTPVWGTLWNPTASAEPSGGGVGTAGFPGTAGKARGAGGGPHFSPQPTELRSLEGGPALRRDMPPAAALGRGPSETLG